MNTLLAFSEIIFVARHRYLYDKHSLLGWKNFLSLYKKVVKMTDANLSFKGSSVFEFFTVSTTQPINFDNTPNSDCQFCQFHQQITNSFLDQYPFRKYLIGGFNV